MPKLPGLSLERVATSPDGSIWAVGENASSDRGFLLRSTGGRFTSVALPPGTGALRDIVAPAADVAWAVGVDGVLRWDGRALRRSPAPDAFLSAVSASAPDDIWAVGDGKGLAGVVVLNWNGRTWKKVPFLPTPPHKEPVFGGRGAITSFARLRDVLAIAKNDVWVVGEASQGGGLAAHWDGNAWHSVSVPASFSGFSVIAAGAAGEVWAAGNSIIAEWDGHAWRVRARPNRYILDIATRGTEVWAAAADTLARWNGSAWIPLLKPPLGSVGLAVDAQGAVWVLGGGPVVYRYHCTNSSTVRQWMDHD